MADAVANGAEEIDARIVVVGGDVRAKGFLLEHLPERIAHLTIESRHHRSRRLAAEVVRHVAAVVASDTEELLQQLRERELVTNGEREPRWRAATVDTLLVHDDPVDDRVAWLAGATVVALERDGLGGGDDARTTRFADAAIRAALATGASVRIIPKGVAYDGIAALLRFPVPEPG